MFISRLLQPACLLVGLTITAITSATPLATALATAQAPAPAGVSTLSAALDAAWQRAPQARSLEAQRNEVQAGNEAAQAWIAGSPVMGLAQRSDRWNDNRGRRESELSLAAPIWLPGQHSARQRLAQANTTDLAAQLANTRLQLAGEVRERMWAVVAAREALTEAQEHLAHLAALSNEVMRRVKAGDLARTDGLLAQQEVLAARAAVTLAQAQLNEPLARWHTLTGQKQIPPAEAEASGSATLEQHPRMIMAHTVLQQAEAALGVAHAVRADPLTVGMALRREHDNAGAAAKHSLAVSVQIPLGNQPLNRVQTSAAQTRIDRASAEALQTKATLATEIELARSQLTATREALDNMTARVALAREHASLIEKAFRLGERALTDALRARALVHDAHLLEIHQRVALGLAHARLNQALGILP